MTTQAKEMTDTIQPVPLTDHMVPLNDIIITASLIIAGQLDPQVLRDAFAKLVDQWPKLGARLVKGKAVYHCPHALAAMYADVNAAPGLIRLPYSFGIFGKAASFYIYHLPETRDPMSQYSEAHTHFSARDVDVNAPVPLPGLRGHNNRMGQARRRAYDQHPHHNLL